MAPTEMSKLPEMMRMVAPAATSPSTDDCSRMLMMLRGLKKRSLMRPVKTPRPIVSSRMSTHWLAATKASVGAAPRALRGGPRTAGPPGGRSQSPVTPTNSFIRLCSVASAAATVATMRPWRMMAMRSLIESSSGRSDETMMTARPARSSSAMNP